jgi:transposase, IS6 family
VQRLTPLYQGAARPHRRRVGQRWSVDETYVRVAGVWQYAYRAIDEHGQVIDVNVTNHRAAEDAAAFFRRSLADSGVRPQRVTTDTAACYPLALAEHVTGKLAQQAIERDHQHLKGRPQAMRAFQTQVTAQVVCAGHGLVRNLPGGHHRLGLAERAPGDLQPPPLSRAWRS